VCWSFESVYEPYAALHGGGTVSSSTAGCCTTGRSSRAGDQGRLPRRGARPGADEAKTQYELIEEPYLLELLTAAEQHTALFHELYSR
jgi:hypothetical protein